MPKTLVEKGFIFIMKEILTIMAVIYGLLIGIYLILGLSKSKLEKEKEKQMAVVLMNSMLGNELKKKRKFVVKLVLFQFVLLFGYTLISIWLNFDYSTIRMVAVVLMIIELVEIAIRVASIYRAKNLKELFQKNAISKATPYIYILGIAILTGAII